MSRLSAIPERPLTSSECHALHESGAFVSVIPKRVLVDSAFDPDRKYVVGMLVVTDNHVVAVAYDFVDRSWNEVFREERTEDHDRIKAQLGAAEAALVSAGEALESDGRVDRVHERDVGEDDREAPSKLVAVYRAQYEDWEHEDGEVEPAE